MEVLRRRAHRHRGVVDEPLGDEARVEVDLGAHRVVAHVLDAAGEDDVRSAHRDLAGAGGHRGQRTGAHPVEREARDAVRDPGQKGHVPAQRQALVADLRRRREDHVADPLGRQRRVPAQQLADDLDRHVVRPRLPEEPLRAGAAERGSQTVDVDNLA